MPINTRIQRERYPECTPHSAHFHSASADTFLPFMPSPHQPLTPYYLSHLSHFPSFSPSNCPWPITHTFYRPPILPIQIVVDFRHDCNYCNLHEQPTPRWRPNLMPLKRSIMRIQLDTGAKNRIEEICARRGMTQISMMSRVVHWFSQQDEEIQTAVLASLTEESNPALTKSLLKKFSSY